MAEHEYIWKQSLITKCKESAACDWNKKVAPVSWSDAYRQFADDVGDFPAADVVEVVRCKDCKYYHLETAYCDKHSYFIDSDGVSCSPAESPSWTMWDADAFCSYGERRDDHETD